jgi:pyridoxine 5-phosphate synthase
MIKLGVNIDHIATLRQARRKGTPSVVEAALVCEKSGAYGITVHLREDRRHIQDYDVYSLREILKTKLNLEMVAD